MSESATFSFSLVRGVAMCSADEEADSLRTNAYNKALSVKDEFFHFELYDWYLSRSSVVGSRERKASRYDVRVCNILVFVSAWCRDV
jgi:hypothetical protein